ncbi:MAG: regulatory protein RecX [Ruminococcus sp.]|nr:regulatory protein RecX [Ruminococcus sp.]
MLITAIEPRRKGLSALFIDGEFAMNLDTQALLENRFDVGRDISDEDLKEMIELSNERRAKEKALWLISYRSHSKKELKDKIRRTCDDTSAEKAVERMEELGLVNDEEYARQFARKLLLQKKMARRAAMLEMSRKGIDKETAEAALDEVDVDYRENIRYIIEKKYRDIGDEKIKRRAVAALQRLGYGWDDIRAVLNEYE